MRMDVDFTQDRSAKPTQDIMGSCQLSLKNFLERARQVASGKVDYLLLNEDGAQVNDHRATVTLTLEEYAKALVPNDRKGESNNSRDWRSHTGHRNEDTYTQQWDRTVEGTKSGGGGGGGANGGEAQRWEDNDDQPTLSLWVKYRNERPIQA